MNRKSLIAAAALAAASLSSLSLYAVEGRQVQPDTRASSVESYPGSTADATKPISSETGMKSREEVKAELRDAKAQGLYQDVQEASPTPLDDMHRNQKLAQISEEQRVSSAQHDDLMALADRADEAPVIIIESEPSNAAPVDDGSGALPFEHPAVRDGGTSQDQQAPTQ